MSPARQRHRHRWRARAAPERYGARTVRPLFSVSFRFGTGTQCCLPRYSPVRQNCHLVPDDAPSLLHVSTADRYVRTVMWGSLAHRSRQHPTPSFGQAHCRRGDTKMGARQSYEVTLNCQPQVTRYAACHAPCRKNAAAATVTYIP